MLGVLRGLTIGRVKSESVQHPYLGFAKAGLALVEGTVVGAIAHYLLFGCFVNL
jgi:hypothetical protein